MDYSERFEMNAEARMEQTDTFCELCGRTLEIDEMNDPNHIVKKRISYTVCDACWNDHVEYLKAES